MMYIRVKISQFKPTVSRGQRLDGVRTRLKYFFISGLHYSEMEDVW